MSRPTRAQLRAAAAHLRLLVAGALVATVGQKAATSGVQSLTLGDLETAGRAIADALALHALAWLTPLTRQYGAGAPITTRAQIVARAAASQLARGVDIDGSPMTITSPVKDAP